MPSTPLPIPREAVALMVRQPWVDHLLSGKKIWEIRGTNTHIRGEVFLAASGTGTLLGKAELADVVGPLSPEEFRRTANLHLTPEEELNGPLPYRKTYAWVFRSPERFTRPIRYRHPSGAITWVILKDFTPGVECFTGPWSLARQQFVESLANDVRRLGHDVDVTHDTAWLRVSVRYQDQKFEDQQHVRAVYRAIAGDGDTLPAEEPVHEVPQVTAIRPEFRLCTSEEEKAAFEAARKVQHLPSTSVGGRNLRAILWDHGVNPPRVMGVIGLSGATYAVQCRDDFLQWTAGSSRQSRHDTRQARLGQIMHLSICAALPPYNRLRVGKLLALLAFSSPIAGEYRRRWGDPLMAITTTSAFGNHGSIFRRLRPNRMEPRSRYAEFTSLLYHRIGESSGEYFPAVSDETRRLAADFLRAEFPGALEGAQKFGDEGVVKKAMLEAGLPRDLLRFVKMGFFLGYLHEECLRVLRGFDMPLFSFSLEPEDCINHWRTLILKPHPSANETPATDPSHEAATPA